jgi:hypothetical protein
MAVLVKLDTGSQTIISSKPLHNLILVTSNMIRSQKIASRKVLLSMSYHWSIALLHRILETMDEDINAGLLKSILSAYDFLLNIKEMQNASMILSEYYPSEAFFRDYPNHVYFNLCSSLESSLAHQSLQTQRQCYQRLVLLRILSQSVSSMKDALLIRNHLHETPFQFVTGYHQREQEFLLASSISSSSSSSSQPTLAIQIIQLFMAFDKNSPILSRRFLDDSSSISSMTSIEDTSSDDSYTSSSRKRMRSSEDKTMLPPVRESHKRPCQDQDFESSDVLSYAANIMVLLNQATA